MKKVGIWIDSKVAYLIDPQKGVNSAVLSKMEHYHPHGGSRASKPYLSHDSMKDTTLLGRKKNQVKDFCNAIMASLGDAKDILIFGPAQMKLELGKALHESRQFNTLHIDVKSADKMSDNQMAERVRNYFK